MDNAKVIWDYLKNKGLNDFAVAGIMGNLFAESALNPRNLQNSYENALNMNDNAYVAAVDNGTYTNFVRDSAGFGLAQWTYWSRKQNLLNFAKAVGASIGDLQMQLDFFWKEIQGYTGVMLVLRSATSVLEASNAVLLNYERPANQSEGVQKKRAEYGQRYYDQFAMTSAKGGGSMKYNENNKPLVCMQTQSTCYRGTKKMKVLGVLWHSTGANNPWLKRYVQPSDNDPNKSQLLTLLGKNAYGNDWNHIEHDAGLNCWIGKLADGTVTTVQTMPWDYKPWGCGGACNNGWIQFEICEDGLTDPDYFNKVYKEACEITAYLCKMYGINPKGAVQFNGKTVPTILCHWDSYTLGLGSGHSDVTHWFPKFGKSMATAREDVAALMNGQTTAPITTPATNYQVRVTANDGLNCRTTYSTSGKVLTTYSKGTVLTITKEQNGWGYTGLGWVSLAYVEKISTTVVETEDEDMDKARFSELFGQMRKDLQDNDAGSWSEAARQWAVSTGLIAGNGTTINGEPNCMWADFLTREQLVTVLYRFAQMMGKA